MIIVKLSGKALNDGPGLNRLFKALIGQSALIVHGGGVEVDSLLTLAGAESVKKDGIRVSPAEHMPYITAALAGICNKKLQAAAVKAGVKAVGMLCSDYDLCTVDPYPAEYGFVGHCRVKNFHPVKHLCEDAGYVPVICSLGFNGQGDMYNINADEVAAALAVAFKCPLFFFSDVRGVLDISGRIIEEITSESAEQMIADGIISGGMTVKIKNALETAAKSSSSVCISSLDSEALEDALALRRRIGTYIRVR